MTQRSHPSGLQPPTRLTPPVDYGTNQYERRMTVETMDAQIARIVEERASKITKVASATAPATKPKRTPGSTPRAGSKPVRQMTEQPSSGLTPQQEAVGRLLPEALDRAGVREPFEKALAEIAREQRTGQARF